MAGAKPRICASIVDSDITVIKKAESLVDLFEVRIDLIGGGWRKVAGCLRKPWISCNRMVEEGGKWGGSEPDRTRELLAALELGAAIIDIELATPGVGYIVKKIHGRAKCIVSYHNIKETPSLKDLKVILERELSAGADICKVVTTARSIADNLTVLRLIKEFPRVKMVAFAMGAAGQVSRILCSLVGGHFTYTSIKKGRESADGQITVSELRKIYEMIEI